MQLALLLLVAALCVVQRWPSTTAANTEYLPTLVMHACSTSPHRYVGTDKSLLLRRVLGPAAAVAQFCAGDGQPLSTAACNKVQQEVGGGSCQSTGTPLAQGAAPGMGPGVREGSSHCLYAWAESVT